MSNLESVRTSKGLSWSPSRECGEHLMQEGHKSLLRPPSKGLKPSSTSKVHFAPPQLAASEEGFQEFTDGIENAEDSEKENKEKEKKLEEERARKKLLSAFFCALEPPWVPLPDDKPKQKGKKKVVKGGVASPKGTTQAGRYTTSRRNTPITQASAALAKENAQTVSTRLC